MRLRMFLIVLLIVAPLRAADRLPALHTDGTQIVDESRKPLTLRGVNLGGWLVEEMWMMPFVTRPPVGSGEKEIRDHVTLWSTIEARLGKDSMQRMRVALRENWITEADFDRMRDAGVSCVRVPFLCDSLEPPDDLFFWLDRAIDWASKRGIYVILDMHGAPGRQSKDHHTGEAGVNRFFYDDANVTKCEQIWKQIATRYRDRAEVAGYDLLNEPMGAPNPTTLYLVQDRLYRAIRTVDDKHVIFIEDGYKGAEGIPFPNVCGWKNVCLSIHTYKFDAKGPEDQVAHLQETIDQVRKAQKDRNVPFYIGEFNTPHGDAQNLASFCSTFDEHGWSWSMWCYKIGKNRGPSLWGWVRAPDGIEWLDPFTDSEEQWNRKVKQVRTENMVVQDEVGAALGSRGK
jgi:endoglucanase